MSFQAMTWALRQKTGSPTAKAILLALANYADDEGSCFPGQDRLAEECECHVRTIQRQLEYLERGGFLRRTRRADGRGARTSDRYFLLLHDKLSPDIGDEPKRQIVGASKDEPIRRTISSKIQAREEAGLLELRAVLDDERAQAVLDHRKRLGKALTAHAARLLAKRLSEASDANAAADEMICNGWQGFSVHWLRAKGERSGTRKARADAPSQRAGERAKASSAPSRQGSKIKVSAVTEPELFDLCEVIAGRRCPRNGDGAWWFDADVVMKAQQEQGGAANG